MRVKAGEQILVCSYGRGLIDLMHFLIEVLTLKMSLAKTTNAVIRRSWWMPHRCLQVPSRAAQISKHSIFRPYCVNISELSNKWDAEAFPYPSCSVATDHELQI